MKNFNFTRVILVLFIFTSVFKIHGISERRTPNDVKNDKNKEQYFSKNQKNRSNDTGICFECGDGSDGVYAPAVNADLPGGNYQFSSVNIPAGVIITVTGSEPLNIQCTGAVIIDGIIRANGGEGGNGITFVTFGVGGTGVAGGNNGGNGVYSNSLGPLNGFPGTGMGGGQEGAGWSGGGGGGHLNNGSNSGGVGGSGGISYGDPLAVELLGGSGGGGGSGGYSCGAGGGGAGGGIIVITSCLSVTIGSTGSIECKGGNGGSDGTGNCGAGGGGSGGSIRLNSTVIINNGSLNVDGGTGGQSTVAGSPYFGNGGNGSQGRTQINISNPCCFVDVDQPDDQIVCNNTMTAMVSFSGSTPGTVFNWTNSNPSIGLPANGVGDIAAFTAINTGNLPQQANITVTPYKTGDQVTEVFDFTGSLQTFTVPVGVTSINIDARGAQGGGSVGGLGGLSIATVPVTPGEILEVWVGGRPTLEIGPGGFNGGGAVIIEPCGSGPTYSWPGGGASDIRRGTGLGNRIIVAGGGGGQGWSTGPGGSGGGTTGSDGAPSWIVGTNGKGGTQIGGGAGGYYSGNGQASPDGIFGFGGDGSPLNTYCTGGGGGGGYYGGGGGYVSAGGGGSSYISYPGLTNTSTMPGIREGNGVITISYLPDFTCNGTSKTFIITVNPTPVGSALPQTICSGGTSSIALSSTTPPEGTSYTWTAAIQTAPTGGTITGFSNCAASCGASIAQTLLNTGTTLGVVRYTVTPFYTNAGQTCTGTAFTVDVTVTSIVTGSTMITGVSCFGGSNGTINLTASGGTPGYTYNWGSGITTEDRTGLATGTYTVTITDANGCTGNTSAMVNQPGSAVTGSTMITGVSCFGGSNGTINLTASGGTPGYTYNWGSGITTEDRTGLATGIYTVTITDVNGCTGNTSAMVNQPTLLTANATMTNLSCFGGSNGTIDLTVGGGTPGYTYSWSNGQTIQNLSGLGFGVYSVTVTDANGCSKIASASISQPAVLVLSSTTYSSCTGGATGTIDLTVSGGTPGYSYLWSNGLTSQDQSGLTGGTYTVTVTDANGCTKTTAAIVSQSIAIILSTTTIATCVGGNIGSIDLMVSGGNPTYSYLWSNTSTTQDINGLGVGTYTVTVTDVSNCTASTSASITTLSLPCGWSAEPNGVGCNAGNTVAYNFNTQRFTVTSTNCYYPNFFTSDALAFAQYDLCGNGSITAQVTGISPLGQGWAGVTMRESNAAGAKKAQLMTNLSDLSRREFRTTTNGAAYPQQFPSQNRYWLRITRTGNQFVMYVSPNGATWYPSGAQTISMNSCIEVGLVVTNYTPNSTVTATFANVTVTGNMFTRPVINTLEDQLADVDFSIVPNPTNGWIAIDLSAYQQRKVQMELYNIQGKLLRTLHVEKNQGKEEVDFSTFANGIYLVRVKAEGLPDVTKRVVVNSNQ